MIKKFFGQVAELFGFKRSTLYVRNYLHKANMRSGVFMAAVIVVLELWLIIRQTNKYVIPRWDNPNYIYGHFQVFFTFTQTYWLLMTFGLAMGFYCAAFKHSQPGKRVLPAIICSGISLALCCLLPLEFIFSNSYNAIRGKDPLDSISVALILSLYISTILFNVFTIIASVYKSKGGDNQVLTSVLPITFFALTCLAFGVKVSYSDFAGTSVQIIDGVETIVPNPDYKGIICFLMMAMYVGCLLIWKPYVSVGILGVIFLGFYFLLKTVTIRKFPEGDEINYLTFFISLTMICISIYNQRVHEAKKDEELERLATKDKLTDLYAFEYFTTLCSKKIKKEEIKPNEFIYLFLNISSFKIYNDQRGFEQGNIFLKKVGEILTSVLPNALISRQSDDHFVIFTKNENVEETLKTISDKIRELDPDIRPGVKVGGYLFNDNEEDVHNSIERARYAYAVLKRQGGQHNYLLYDQTMQDRYTLVQYIVAKIDKAVEEGWIVAYYQPVVYAKDRKLCGVEALARWVDPKYGFLNPGVFVGALEDAQLAYKLDLAILEIVCKNMRRVLDSGEVIVPTSINFSRADFSIIDVPNEIVRITGKYKIDPKYLHIEITESALLEETVDLKEAMNRIKKNGFAIWLDDFGSGYSSFNALKDYAFDVLKLDMEFLKGFETNKKSKPLIKSVIDMAGQVGMRTLAEGVETETQAEFLKEIGCEKLQGYLISKPISYEELNADIANGKFVISKKLD